MKKPTVYIETTIISFLTSRPSRDLSIWWYQHTTREWWDFCRDDFQLYISTPVYDEISRGDISARASRLEAVRGLELLRTTPEAEDLAQELLECHSLPAKASLDALHIALAAYYDMDYLLTWNCKHIANAASERLLKKSLLKTVIAIP